MTSGGSSGIFEMLVDRGGKCLVCIFFVCLIGPVLVAFVAWVVCCVGESIMVSFQALPSLETLVLLAVGTSG